jgi:hypothetical protein
MRRQVTAYVGSDRRAARAVPFVDPWLLAAVGLAAIALLGALGVVHLLVEPEYSRFDLDAEGTVPAAFSAALLAALGATAVAVAVFRADGGSRWPWAVFGLVGFMGALDEGAQVHERLESITGVDWQTLYLPVFVLAAAAWVIVLRRLRAVRHAVPLFTAGAAAWVFAQALEFLQWDADDRKVAAYDPMMVAEELLEMVGTLALWLAIALVLRARSRTTA